MPGGWWSGVVFVSIMVSGVACTGFRKTPEPASSEPDAVIEAYRHSTAALALPGATRAFQILPSGDLTNGDWVVRVHATGDGSPASLPKTIAFEDRWLPVAHWTRRTGAVRWDFEAVALPETGLYSAADHWTSFPAPRDSGLIVAIEARVSNKGVTPVDATLEFDLVDLDSTVVFLAPDAGETPPHLAWAGTGSNQAVNGWCSMPDIGAIARNRWRLRPHAVQTVRCLLPAYPVSAAALVSYSRLPRASLADQMRSVWRTEMARGAQFNLGDPEVESALRAALVVLLECRERRGTSWVPIGGPLHYRDVWLRDGARAIGALSMMGYGREARELSLGLMRYQWPQGAFLSQRGQLDGTGQVLWAFGQALLRPPSAESLEPFVASALAAWRWSERQRAVGRASGFPFGAMLPFADPRDNELVSAQLVGNDAWAIAGYRATVQLLRASGRAAEADSVARSCALYQLDFGAALRRSGSQDVPAAWQGGGRDWGNLSVSYPCGALSPLDSRCSALAKRVWMASGGAGLLAYGQRDSLQLYMGADLGTWALLTGRRASGDSVLSALLRWRSASGGAAELFSQSTRDFGTNPPPHATAAAALIGLIRNSIVFDDDDTLRLTLGARPSWWRYAHCRRLPTRWGTIDLEFEREGVEAQWRWSRVPVWTALTLPPGTVLRDRPAAPFRPGMRPDVLLAPPGTQFARVALAERVAP